MFSQELCAIHSSLYNIGDFSTFTIFFFLVPQLVCFKGGRPEFNFLFRFGSFSRSTHAGDLEIGSQVATLPGAWCYRVSARTDWPGVCTLWLGETESLILESLVCSFYLSAAAHTVV